MNLKWDYADEKGWFDPMKVAMEMNGRFLEDVTIGDKTYKKGECVPSFALLKRMEKLHRETGSIAVGFTQDGTNLSMRRKKDDPTGLGLSRNGHGHGRSTTYYLQSRFSGFEWKTLQSE